MDGDDRLVNLNARVPKRLMRGLRIHCLEENLLLRTVIHEALVERLAQQRRPLRQRKPRRVTPRAPIDGVPAPALAEGVA